MCKSAFKVLVFSLVLSPFTALAQNSRAEPAGSPGCGDFAVKFDVKTTKGKPGAQSEAGKATVYFIEEDSNYKSIPKPTTRAGLDGQWVGATHGNSYLSFSVDPGVHHLCASWQFGAITGLGNKTALTHFNAEADSVYYFEVKDTLLQTETSPIVEISLVPLDSDEGQFLVNKSALSTSQKKP